VRGICICIPKLAKGGLSAVDELREAIFSYEQHVVVLDQRENTGCMVPLSLILRLCHQHRQALLVE
jgi:hypothetical protein